jgi:hypothetical protein
MQTPHPLPVVCLASAVMAACATSPRADLSIAAIAHRFSSAPDQRARLDVVLQAIDHRTIRVGMALSDLQAILGSGDVGTPDDNTGWMKVVYDFAPQGPGRGAFGQSPPQPSGWYLVAFNDGHSVQNYYLSNTHLK